MTPTAILDAIQRHRAFSHNKIEALRREIAEIEKDSDELAIAERVVRRIAAESSSQSESESDLQDHEAEAHRDPVYTEPPLYEGGLQAQSGEPEYSYGH